MPVVHATLLAAGLLGALLATIWGCPLVYTVANLLRTCRPRSVLSTRAGMEAVADSLVMWRADAIHTVSEFLGTQVRRQFPTLGSKVWTIEDTFSAPHRCPEDRSVEVLEIPAVARSGARLLCMGRLTPHKQQALAVEAMIEIAAHRTDAVLLIVGDGPCAGALRDLVAARRLEERVWVTGPTSSPQAFLDWADVLVHPSLYEGFPRVFAEASSLGTSIVAANIPASRDQSLRKPGSIQLAPARSSLGLARAVLHTLDHSVGRADDRTQPEPPTTATTVLRALYRTLQPV
jgi:glycosyltransferase involved in cell wall biosynthesis